MAIFRDGPSVILLHLERLSAAQKMSLQWIKCPVAQFEVPTPFPGVKMVDRRFLDKGAKDGLNPFYSATA